MATEFRLTVAGNTPAADLAQRALPGVTFTQGARTLGADTTDQLGAGVVVRTGTGGYVEAVGDNGTWTWEPETFAAATFRLAKDPDGWDRGLHTMLESVARVLATGAEDAALVLDGDDLILTRLNGLVVKHHRTDWWGQYPWADQVIPG